MKPFIDLFSVFDVILCCFYKYQITVIFYACIVFKVCQFGDLGMREFGK